MDMSLITAIRWYKLQAVQPVRTTGPLWKCALLPTCFTQSCSKRIKITHKASTCTQVLHSKIRVCWDGALDTNQSCFPKTIAQMTKSKTALRLEKVSIGHEGFCPWMDPELCHFFFDYAAIPVLVYIRYSDGCWRIVIGWYHILEIWKGVYASIIWWFTP